MWVFTLYSSNMFISFIFISPSLSIAFHTLFFLSTWAGANNRGNIWLNYIENLFGCTWFSTPSNRWAPKSKVIFIRSKPMCILYIYIYIHIAVFCVFYIHIHRVAKWLVCLILAMDCYRFQMTLAAAQPIHSVYKVATVTFCSFPTRNFPADLMRWLFSLFNRYIVCVVWI